MMTWSSKIFSCLVLTVLFTQILSAQINGLQHTISLVLTKADTSHQLPHQFLVTGSETVLLDSVRKLQRDVDYQMNDRFGIVKLSRSLLQQIFLEKPSRSDTAVGIRHSILITYQYLPIQLKDKYYHREVIVKRDTTTGRNVQVAVPSKPLTLENIFGSNLQRSGSIVRGFTLGSNRDLSLNSGFRLQFSGKIASDVEIVAALTDENTPLQPEGNTQTLQEIDKVFVDIRSTNLGATLGDFNLDFKESEFGRFSRKLQGARGSAEYRLGSTSGSVVLSGAITRGKFTTNQFLGIEGVQGPYQLTGPSGKRDIIVVAGTEKVYVDGEPVTRGETNDYIIEYGNGEITFTPKRLINSASRITVDFEYSDRQFTRTLAAAKIEESLSNDKMKFDATYFREGDDYDSPIDISLSDSDRAILQQAGNDRLKASKSSITFVGRDSVTQLGKGQYARTDTMINGNPYQYFRYAPGDTNSLYSVGFSFIGQGQGDYVRESIGQYRWVGIGQGSYQPVQLLPLPQLHQIVDFSVTAQPTNFLSFNGEYAFSNFDGNRLSSLDDENNSGNAFKFSARLNPKEVRIGDVNLGSVDLAFNERFINRKFVPIDRINDIEFTRKWNILDSSQVNEETREAKLSYQPFSSLKFGGSYGWIERGSGFTSTRGEAVVNVAGERLPKADYTLEIINSNDGDLDTKGRWIRQKGLIDYTIPTEGVCKLIPGFRYDGEERDLSSIIADTLKNGSFRFNEFAPRLSLLNLLNMSLTGEFSIRTDDMYSSGGLVRQSQSLTQTYGWRLNEWNSLSSTLDVGLRKTTFTKEFKLKGNSDVETILLKWQTKYTPFNRGLDADLFYQVSTQRSAKLQRVFFLVEKGMGNYKYLGDLNHNGVPDESEFQLSRFDADYILITVPTDQLFPVIDLKTSTRLRLTPSRFIRKPETFLETVLTSISTETYLRVEENSSEQDTRQIYLLHFDRFQDDSTTIRGSNIITQDVNVLENNQDISFRFRFNQRKGFNQFASGNERSLTIERSMRVRWHLVQEITNEIDFVNRLDRMNAPVASSRAHDIVSNTISSDLSYRPEQNIEVGFKLDVGKAVDRFPVLAGGRETTAHLNTETIRFTYSFQARGRARAELERDEVLLDTTSQYVPFELTNGAVAGQSWLWRLAVDYRFGSFVQATLSYDGRSEGGRSPVHTGRTEVRAFF